MERINPRAVGPCSENALTHSARQAQAAPGSGSISIGHINGNKNAIRIETDILKEKGDDEPWRGITETPAEAVWALVCGIDPRVSRRRRIAVQVAYIDESMSTSLTMAGFISTVEKWAEFSKAWKTELDKPPTVPFFHMKDLLREKGGVFGNAPLDQRIEKVKKLIAIINKHTEADFKCSMKLESYNRILRPALNNFKKLRKFDQPYLWLFVVGVLEGLSTLEIYGRKGKKIQFVFDQNETLFKGARKIYERFSSIDAFAEAKAVVESVEERDNKIVLPLQAADLLAWNINRTISKPIPGEDPLDGYGMAFSNLELLRSGNRESWPLEMKDEALQSANRAINTAVILGSTKPSRKF